MADKLGSGKSSNSVTTDLHAGLSNKAAKWPDASAGMKGGKSVDDDTTRSSVAATPKTLGPRSA